jgi:hypothetical protein
MFGIFSNQKKVEKEAADRIGVELHRQIRAALERGGKEVESRTISFFIAGYLFGFIRAGFTIQGIPGEQAADKYVRHICDGVIPKRLYEIFERYLAALELAKSLDKKEEIEQFEVGVNVGIYDSAVFNPLSGVQANNLFKYLASQELQYELMPK